MAFRSIGSLATDVLAEAEKRVAAARKSAAHEFDGGPTKGGVPVEPPTLGSTRATASSDGKGKVADAETPAKCDQMGDNRRVKHRSRPVLLEVNNRERGVAMPPAGRFPRRPAAPLSLVLAR